MDNLLAQWPDPLAAAERPAADWIRTPADEIARDAGYLFSERLVDFVADWIRNNCVLAEAPWHGQPLTITDWQRRHIIGPAFGWIHPRTGLRRHRFVYVQAPKKTAGKSTLCAALGLVHLFEEAGAKVINLASNVSQASSIVHGIACDMVELGPLAALASVARYRNEIKRQGNSWFKSIAQKPFSGPSLNSCIFDEIHEYKDARAYNTLIQAGIARRQPLFWAITNAGENLDGLAFQLYEKCKAVQDGDLEDLTFYGYILESPRAAAEAEIRAVAAGSQEIPVAAKCNPGLGTIVSKADMVNTIRAASRTTWETLACLRWTYCVWVQAEDRDWLGPLWPGSCEDYTEADLIDQPCHGGFDRAASRDMTSLVLLFGPDERGIVRQLPFFWLPQDRVTKLAHLIPEIHGWVNGGFLRVFPGNVFDFQLWQDDVRELCERFKMLTLTYDKHKAETETQWLPEIGVERQTFSQSNTAYNQFAIHYEEAVASGTLRHNGHPVFEWQAKNAVRYRNAQGYVKPVKRTPDDYRTVDGIQAAMMGYAQILLDTPTQALDYYAHNDLEFI